MVSFEYYQNLKTSSTTVLDRTIRRLESQISAIENDADPDKGLLEVQLRMAKTVRRINIPQKNLS